MKIKLFTRDGGFVAAADIPPFINGPDVILWGDRVFRVPDVHGQCQDSLAGLADDEYGYVEAFAYAIPDALLKPVGEK